MIRQAEQNIRTIGNDIKDVVYGELSRLQQVADRVAEGVPRSDEEITHDFLQAQLGAFSGTLPVNLAAALAADGTFKNGCSLFPGEPLHVVEPREIQPYFSSASPLLSSLRSEKRKSLPGIIVLDGRPLFFALSPVKAADGRFRGFILLGSLLKNAALINRINAVTPGMQVALANRPGGRASTSAPLGQEDRPSPVFHDVLTFR